MNDLQPAIKYTDYADTPQEFLAMLEDGSIKIVGKDTGK